MNKEIYIKYKSRSLPINKLSGGSINELIQKILDYYQIPNDEEFKKVIMVQQYYTLCTTIITLNTYLKSWYNSLNLYGHNTFSDIVLSYKGIGFTNMNRVLITLSTTKFVLTLNDYLNIEPSAYLPQDILDIQKKLNGLDIKKSKIRQYSILSNMF